ncbi:hypothetical protein LEMLEM_LOCUS6701, partial [Lemmus lemmus]
CCFTERQGKAIIILSDVEVLARCGSTWQGSRRNPQQPHGMKQPVKQRTKEKPGPGWGCSLPVVPWTPLLGRTSAWMGMVQAPKQGGNFSDNS